MATMQKVPEIVDAVAEAAGEVTIELSYGTCNVIRCIFIGLVFFAALMVVRVGRHFFSCLHVWLLSWSPCGTRHQDSLRDSFTAKYGGKLVGGAYG